MNVSVIEEPVVVEVSEEQVTITWAEGGPQGPRGIPGLGAEYIHDQEQPAAIWNIHHGLHSIPTVVVIDGVGNKLWTGEIFPDLNNTTITMTAPTTGKAYLRS